MTKKQAIEFLKSKAGYVYVYEKEREIAEMRIPGYLVRDEGKKKVVIIVEI